jgi:hypothetical protein
VQGSEDTRRHSPVAAVAAILAGVALAAALLLGSLGRDPASAAVRPCSSYPTPGTVAPATATVPAAIAGRYAVLARAQRPADRLTAGQLGTTTITASGLILSGTRLLGHAASGGRVYLVPAEHLLGYRLAPLRCLPRAQRSLEQALRSRLESEYRHAALCVVVVRPGHAGSTCDAVSGHADALLYTSGTPGYGLVPNGVSSVTITYQSASPRTVPVRHNFFAIVAPSVTVPPCGVQWLDPTGNVMKVVTGCSYLYSESQDLSDYRAYVAAALTSEQSQVATLAGAIAAGNLAQAESAWLTAHLTWLGIGQDDGAYGCFGALGGAIDGLAAGHPLGIADPGFTGFHRVEYDLWTAHNLTAAAADTAALEHLLTELEAVPLSTYLPATATGIGNWVLRPHEVLEDALRDSLTADDDYGSGTDLASLTADVAAVRELLTVLAPTLGPLAPRLYELATRQLGALSIAIAATRPDGGWISIEDLAVRQRQQVDADVDAALETLAPIPELLTSTGHNAPSD